MGGSLAEGFKPPGKVRLHVQLRRVTWAGACNDLIDMAREPVLIKCGLIEEIEM